MQTSSNTQQTPLHKVKNILSRHACPTRVEFSGYQHPEDSYILKYAPKYYKSLTLPVTTQSPLLSKVKKIKKLKTFTGYPSRHLPQKLWFNLLGNTRKEIEEAPQISSYKMNVRPKKAFWEKLNQQKLKHFWNLTKVWLPMWRGSYLINDLDNFLSCKELFVKHVWNLRKLKSLKIMVNDNNYEKVKWVLNKLNTMSGLFKKLEILGLNANTDMTGIKEFLQYKTFFSYLTILELGLRFDPVYAEIPKMTENLTSLFLDFHGEVDEKPEYLALLTSLHQQLTQLKRFEFSWPSDQKDFWSHLKPQASLQYLQIFASHNLINAGSFKEGKMKDIIGHWEEIEALKVLEFSFSCDKPEDFNLVKQFMTNVMKKVKKLETLKISVMAPLETEGPQRNCEPFFLEDASHLYESLERFEYEFLSHIEGGSVKFGLNFLKPFRNLKSFHLEGSMIVGSENLEEVVCLLERNQKEGEYPVLELNLKRSIGSPADWLGNTLGIVERTRSKEKNLQVLIYLMFDLKGYMKNLEDLCKVIQAVKRIKGLKFCLSFGDENDDLLAIDEVRQLLSSRYPGLRNLKVTMSNDLGFFEFYRFDGQKEQSFFIEY